jgi:hypothetical protein
MLAGSWGWEKSFAFNLFRASAKLNSVYINLFSASRLREAVKGMTGFSQSGAYNQEAFQYLLESESKRSERSGHRCQILLLYWTDAQGRIVQMDSHIAKTVMAASSRSLRETDYIGWYRDGRIVGAVLTVLVQESMAQVASRLQERLADVLQSELSIEASRRLQIRVCQHHELEGIELGKETFAVSWEPVRALSKSMIQG